MGPDANESFGAAEAILQPFVLDGFPGKSLRAHLSRSDYLREVLGRANFL